MNILTISGSARTGSKNQLLLEYLQELASEHHFQTDVFIKMLPLFYPEREVAPIPETVLHFKAAVQHADAVFIATPAYLHNIPAVLKNGLEWLTTSGELSAKPVFAVTYTPHEPRGSKAMQSLLWSLTALNARVVGSMDLYHSDITFGEDGKVVDSGGGVMLREAIGVLTKT